jgi:hypothetical protein
VTKAVTQLNNSVHVVRYVISDVAPSMTVQTTLFLPFVTSVQLTRVLGTNPVLLQVGAVCVRACVCVCVCVYVCVCVVCVCV